MDSLDLIVIKVTPELISDAKQWTNFVKNSRTIKQTKENPEDDLTGALGELAFFQIYPDSIRISHQDKEADFITKEGLRVDVKTKLRKNCVEKDYNVTIALYQKNQNCDAYAFFNYAEDDQCIEFVGILEKIKFWKNPQIIKKGEKYPNGYTCSMDCANLTVEQIINLTKTQNTMSNYTPQPNTFSLFANDKGDNPKRPDYKGDIIMPDGTKMRLSAWVRESQGGKKFLSGKVEPMQDRQDSAPSPQKDGDDLPF